MKSLVVAGCLLGLAVAFVQGDITLWMYLRVRLAAVFLSNLPTPAPVAKPPDMLGINVSRPVAFAVIALPAKSALCMMFWQPFRLWLLGWLPNSRKRQKALRQATEGAETSFRISTFSVSAMLVESDMAGLQKSRACQGTSHLRLSTRLKGQSFTCKFAEVLKLSEIVSITVQ